MAWMHVFRLSLVKRTQQDIFERDPGRTEFLKINFSKTHEYPHRSNTFTYVFEKIEKDFIIGKIGRIVGLEANTPPEDGFQPTKHQVHKASFIVIDLSEGRSSQTVYVEADSKIGNPLSIINSLTRKINSENRVYLIDVNPIFSSDTFWKFVHDNTGDVTSLKFEFTVPNGFWSADATLREELEKLKNTTNSEKVSSELKSKSGLNADSKPVRDSIEYIESGSGSVKAKTRSGKVFDSSKNRKKVKIGKNELDSSKIMDAIKKMVEG